MRNKNNSHKIFACVSRLSQSIHCGGKLISLDRRDAFNRQTHVGEIIKQRECQKCGQVRHVKLVRNVAANGISQVYWYCIAHNGPAGQYISHDKLKAGGIDIDDLPIIENYSNQAQCVVCGKLGAEYHHFAPKYLFGDAADSYPVAPLCHEHHMHWHQIIDPQGWNGGKVHD